MKDEEEGQQGLSYILGDEGLPVYGNALICCGACVGVCKAWVPCCGCICCCNDPYVSVPQGSEGILTQFGKYQRTCESGLHYVNPVSEVMIMIDCRITVVDMPLQRLMTRDNIAIEVDSCIYYHIDSPHLNYYRIENVQGSLEKAVGGLIKNTISSFTFQELLEKKIQIAQDIAYQVGPTLRAWGVSIDNICLKNFGLSKELEKELVSAPLARRDGQSKMINAKGQVEIAKMVSQGSKYLSTNTAIQVRFLQTLQELGGNENTCLIYRSC